MRNDDSTKTPLTQNRCCHIGFLFNTIFGFTSAPFKSEVLLKLNIMLRHYSKSTKVKEEFNDSPERDLAVQKLKKLYDSRDRKINKSVGFSDDTNPISL